MIKVVRGYIHHIESMAQKDMDSNEFIYFIDMIRMNIDLIKNTVE